MVDGWARWVIAAKQTTAAVFASRLVQEQVQEQVRVQAR